jgi:hypothetical protein
MFDIGLSIIGDKSKQLDGLYLAGPWGLDYSNHKQLFPHL